LGRLSVLCPGLAVFIVPPTRDGVRHTVVTDAVDDFKKRGVLIRLEGVDDRTRATELVGRYLLASLEQVAEAMQVSADTQAQGISVSEPGGLRQPAGLNSRANCPARAPGPEATHALGIRVSSSIALTHFTDTEYGELGILSDIKSGPAYEIWVIDGQYGELNIPAVAEYIVEESPEHITLSLPKGFVEITTRGVAHEN